GTDRSCHTGGAVEQPRPDRSPHSSRRARRGRARAQRFGEVESTPREIASTSSTATSRPRERTARAPTALTGSAARSTASTPSSTASSRPATAAECSTPSRTILAHPQSAKVSSACRCTAAEKEYGEEG